MALYANRLQVPIKELSADWIPEEGELFQDSSDNLYMGDNVTASNALTPINGGGGGGGGTIEHDPFGYSATTNPSGIGIGEVRFNSTTFGSITKMYVSDNDQNSVDLVAEQSIMTSGVAKLYKADGGKLSFQVTRMVDQSGYFEYDVVPLSGTMPTVGEVCYVDFVPDAPGVRVYSATITTEGDPTPSVTGESNGLIADSIDWADGEDGTFTMTESNSGSLFSDGTKVTGVVTFTEQEDLNYVCASSPGGTSFSIHFHRISDGELAIPSTPFRVTILSRD